MKTDFNLEAIRQRLKEYAVTAQYIGNLEAPCKDIELLLYTIERMTKEREEIIEALQTMADQHCMITVFDQYNSKGLSANAGCLEVLAEYGRVKLTEGHGKIVRAKRIKNAKDNA